MASVATTAERASDSRAPPARLGACGLLEPAHHVEGVGEGTEDFRLPSATSASLRNGGSFFVVRAPAMWRQLSRGVLPWRSNVRCMANLSEAWVALDAIETGERVRVAGLLSGLRELGEKRGGVDLEALVELRSKSINPHRSARSSSFSLPLSKMGGERLVKRLLRGERLDAGELSLLLVAGRTALELEPRIVDIEVSERATVVGDLHGSLRDLRAALDIGGAPSSKNVVVLNGDFVDRGPDGVEVLAAVVALKLAFGDVVHLNRGNHEDASLSRVYDFEAELVAKYGETNGTQLMTDAAAPGAFLSFVRACCLS